MKVYGWWANIPSVMRGWEDIQFPEKWPLTSSLSYSWLSILSGDNNVFQITLPTGLLNVYYAQCLPGKHYCIVQTIRQIGRWREVEIEGGEL